MWTNIVEVADGHYVPAKQQGTVHVLMYDDEGQHFQAVLKNVLYVPALADHLFSIISMMEAGHACTFHNGFCTLYFGDENTNTIMLAHRTERDRALPMRIRERKRKQTRSQVSLEHLHQCLGHRATRSLLAADAAGLWEDVEIRMDPDPFCTSCKVATITKKSRSKQPLDPVGPLKWVFMDIIPSPHSKSIDKEACFANYLLVVDAYSRVPRLFGLEEMTTEAVMDKLDEFQARFGRVDEFGWWDMERITADAGPQFTSEQFKEGCQVRGVRLTLAAPEHQEMNGMAEVTWRTIRSIAHSLMVFARVNDDYTHHALIFAAHHIIPVLPLKDLVNEQGDPVTPIELMTNKKAMIRHLRTLFCPCIIKKHTAQYEG